MKIDLVIYHAGCADGFCAAWLCHRAWPTAEFVPAKYGDPPPDVRGRDVLIVDFSYPRETLIKMAAEAACLIVLDHHRTAEADLKGLAFCRFDMNKSGGRLTYEYLRDNDIATGGVTSEPCWLVDYTEDRDLWQWALADSVEINAALRSYPFDFAVWDGLDMLIGWRQELYGEGCAIRRLEKQLVERHVRHAVEVEIAGHKILAVNATVLESEIAGELAKGRPFGVVWFYSAPGKRVYSLRSEPDGIDVSEVAKKFGGGGHKHAAGFSTAQPNNFCDLYSY